MSAELFLDVLKKWATAQPDKSAWTFLNDSGHINDSYTYEELDRITSHMAVHLLEECKLKKGDRAMLVFFPGLHFMISLVACFKAGIIGVPVFPPDPRKQKKDLHHFISIQSSSGSNVVLSHTLYNTAKKLAAIKNIFSSKDQGWPDLRWISVDSVISKAKSATKASPKLAASISSLPAIQASDIAFLQYTSGSTSDPKGVMISHGNLAHNELLIARELKTTPETVCVSWLPQYHDMGLIGSYLGCLYCGGRGYYLSPISFLKNPVQWVKSMSDFKATHTQAPNFAYALVTRKYLELSSSTAASLKLNLCSLQHMINAAEPVDDQALQMFLDTFQPLGLPGNVVVPTYGLAEHTVFVCSGGLQRLRVKKESLEGRRVVVLNGEGEESGQNNDDVNSKNNDDMDNNDKQPENVSESEGLLTPDTAKEGPTSTSNGHSQKDGDRDKDSGSVVVVGCGYPGRGEGVIVLIVDPDTGDVRAENDIGEIWVTSPSKAMGYWQNPELSAEEFQAVPTNYQDGPEAGLTFLRTGDLGFMHKGELFICGRLKDLIIVRGSNHYPQDMERTAEQGCSEFLRAGCSAAFALQGQGDHTESVVYVAEVKPDTPKSALASIMQSVRTLISANHGLTLQTIVLLKPRTVPKTTSGKIARSWCRKAFQEKSLQVLSQWEGKGFEDEQEPEPEPGYEGDSGVDSSIMLEEPNKSHSNGLSNVPLEALELETSPLTSSQNAHDPKSEAEVRGMSVGALEAELEQKLIQIASQGAPGTLQAPIDRGVSISSLGLDSMTVVQFKGVMENRLHCQFPDEFMFTQRATLHELALAVQHGGLTPAQAKYLEEAPAACDANDGNGDGKGRRQVNVVEEEPLCPWFTCCS